MINHVKARINKYLKYPSPSAIDPVALRVLRYVYHKARHDDVFEIDIDEAFIHEIIFKEYALEILSDPAILMQQNWRECQVRFNGNLMAVLHFLTRDTMGDILEIGRDRGRSLAQFVSSISRNNCEAGHRRILSIDPVMLKDFDADYISEICSNENFRSQQDVLQTISKEATIDPVNQDSLPENYLTILISKRQHYQLIQGFSTEESVMNYVAANSLKLDLLLIDGEHNAKQVKADFDFYSQFVNKNGYIVLDNSLDRHFDIINFINEDIVHLCKNKGMEMVKPHYLPYFNYNGCVLRKL